MTQADRAGEHATLATSRALHERARAEADETERARRLPADLVLAMREAGVFRLCVPRSLGGAEVHVSTLVRTSVALGIARAAIDALVEMASEKVPAFSSRRLAERSSTQVAVAESEADLCAARAFLLEAVERCWEAAGSGAIDPTARALLRVAATSAARRCADAVTRMYETGGGTSIHAGSPLQTHFRDAHVVTQHAAVSTAQLELAGRVLVGLDTDTSML